MCFVCRNISHLQLCSNSSWLSALMLGCDLHFRSYTCDKYLLWWSLLTVFLIVWNVCHRDPVQTTVKLCTIYVELCSSNPDFDFLRWKLSHKLGNIYTIFGVVHISGAWTGKTHMVCQHGHTKRSLLKYSFSQIINRMRGHLLWRMWRRVGCRFNFGIGLRSTVLCWPFMVFTRAIKLQSNCNKTTGSGRQRLHLPRAGSSTRLVRLKPQGGPWAQKFPEKKFAVF